MKRFVSTYSAFLCLAIVTFTMLVSGALPSEPVIFGTLKPKDVGLLTIGALSILLIFIGEKKKHPPRESEHEHDASAAVEQKYRHNWYLRSGDVVARAVCHALGGLAGIARAITSDERKGIAAKDAKRSWTINDVLHVLGRRILPNGDRTLVTVDVKKTADDASVTWITVATFDAVARDMFVRAMERQAKE